MAQHVRSGPDYSYYLQYQQNPNNVSLAAYGTCTRFPVDKCGQAGACGPVGCMRAGDLLLSWAGHHCAGRADMVRAESRTC